MPPFCRSRWVQPRTSRVDRCLSWASSTCSLPSKLRARCAKISRMRPARSSTRHLQLALEVALLARRQRSTKDDEFRPVGLGAGPQLFYLALANKESRFRAFAGADDFVDDDRRRPNAQARRTPSVRIRQVRRLGPRGRELHVRRFAVVQTNAPSRATRVAGYCS